MLYAKSNPIQSIKKHTEELRKREEEFEKLYGKELPNMKIEKDRFFYLLKLAVTYHDYGKVYTPFQNKIRKEIGEPTISSNFSDREVRHEKLSSLFIPFDQLELEAIEEKLLIQAIYYHHEKEEMQIEHELVQKIIAEDILPRYEQIRGELQEELKKDPNALYLTKVGNTKRIKMGDPYYIEYCLLKGLLHRLDHSASAGVEIEDPTLEELWISTQEFLKRFKMNELQEFCKKHQEENVLVIGSTGMGKTEAALLWSKNSKTFFTLPIRVSINAIYTRIVDKIGYTHVGLLHSSSLDYLEQLEMQKEESAYEIWETATNLSSKITTCTIDQIFTFVFKYKGYEKVYATLSYAKVIIDEIQAYSPEIVAVILKGIQMIHAIGGKCMIMTATLPRIYKEKLEEYKIPFQFNKFLSPIKRHWIELQEKGITADIQTIFEKGKDNKVLVIVNTVNKAIEVYKELSKMEPEFIKLLHSRFIAGDKNKLEEEIKEFSCSNKKGIWITTQIVEASLDIDFDYLFTEMSTLDSIFQRLGRCYRSRWYEQIEPNVFIYTQEISGCGYVYDKDIVTNSIKLLEPYNNTILEEKDKVKLVDELYSKQMLQGTKFLKDFNASFAVLDNLMDYGVSKKESQAMLRKIENITVIPEQLYQENLALFEQYENSRGYEEKNQLKRKILKLTVDIKKSLRWVEETAIANTPINGTDIYRIYRRYDRNMGLVIQKDEEYDIELRSF